MVAVPLGPAKVDITGVRAGDLNEFQVTLLAASKAIDLTGKTFLAQARSSKTDTEHLDAVVTISDALAGVILIRWPGNAVRTWMGTAATKKGVWDLQMANGAGADPITVVEGDFSAELDVTR